jgi:hypothetical protein
MKIAAREQAVVKYVALITKFAPIIRISDCRLKVKRGPSMKNKLTLEAKQSRKAKQSIHFCRNFMPSAVNFAVKKTKPESLRIQ